MWIAQRIQTESDRNMEIICPKCQHKNPPDASKCTACAVDLPSIQAKIETKPFNDDELPLTTMELRPGRLAAGDEITIQLKIQTKDDVAMALKVGDTLLLGRNLASTTPHAAPSQSSEETVMTVSNAFRQRLAERMQESAAIANNQTLPNTKEPKTIDLKTYQGLENGISRRHVLIQRAQTAVFITDLDSTNGTRLNGMALTPHQRRVLRDGDELLLGKLLIQVKFTNHPTRNQKALTPTEE